LGECFFFNIISRTPFFGNFLPFLVSPRPRALIYFSFAFWCRVEGSSPSRNLNEEPSPMTARVKEEAYIKATKGETRALAESTAVRLIGYQSYKGYTNTELKDVKTIKNEKMKRQALWIRHASICGEAVRSMASLRGWLMLRRHSSPNGNP
jgi:hypothetical protein